MNKMQKNQLEKHGLDKPIFYDDGSTTVCLLTKNGVPVARGISICSFLDEFSESEGKNKAFGRSVQAFVNQGDDLGTMLESLEYLWHRFTPSYSVRLHNAFLLYGSFASYMPRLLPIEMFLTRNRRGRY